MNSNGRATAADPDASDVRIVMTKIGDSDNAAYFGNDAANRRQAKGLGQKRHLVAQFLTCDGLNRGFRLRFP